MSATCVDLHALVRRGTFHSFPFDTTRLPPNGIYVLFEAGEECHGGGRIVIAADGTVSITPLPLTGSARAPLEYYTCL